MAPTRALAVLFVIALALVGCSKAEPEVDPVSQVPADQRPAEEGSEGGSEGGGGGGATFVAVDISYESAPETLPAGDVEITLTNNGAAMHNVTFDDISSDPVVEANGGETKTGTVTLEAGQTYAYHCSVPGHESLMNGEVTVE